MEDQDGLDAAIGQEPAAVELRKLVAVSHATIIRVSPGADNAVIPRTGSLAEVRILMLAPPGGGKGTQGVRLAAELGVPHISSGDVLRREVAEGTELGREVEAHMAAGRLAPDELVTRAVRPVISRLDGYILDGYPRTLAQAEGLDFDAVVYLRVGEQEVMRRMLARGRSDDRPDVIRQRLREYDADTQPLIDHYRDVLVEVDGERDEDAIAADLAARVRPRPPA
jgi:adenylate kinase